MADRRVSSATRKQGESEVASLLAAGNEQRRDAAVQRLVEEWAAVVPGLDADVRAIAARIARINDRLREQTATVLKEAELSDNEFRLLAGLMRMGEPHCCAPTDLAGRYVPVTSGGLTGVAKKLEQRGLISRVAHPRDQRSSLVAITPAGKSLALRTMERFAEAEKALMGKVNAADRERGNRFLHKLLESIESSLP